MLLKLCLMASHGYPPGLVSHQDFGLCKVSKGCQPLLPSHGSRLESLRHICPTQRSSMIDDSWKSQSRLLSDQFVKSDSAVQQPVLIDVQETHPDSILFSFGIAEQCKRHDKILQFLMSGTSKVGVGELNMTTLSGLMGLQPVNGIQQPCMLSLVNQSANFLTQKPLLDFVVDLGLSSNIIVHPDGQVLFTGTGAEMKDLLSVVAEFYLSRKSMQWRKQPILIPQFQSLNVYDIGTGIHGSSLNVQATTVAPLKSPEKIKLKPSQKKKNGRKMSRERDLYRKNYSYACESLLSLMVNKREHGRMRILSLTGPELPELLTQFSACIAGTGLAILFSVACKVAGGSVPFSASKLLNTGFGFGLVWLSWAVTKLRGTIVYISKNAGKIGLKDEEIMERLDKSFREIRFRAVALFAIVLLRLV